jgi:hypothetical protein
MARKIHNDAKDPALDTCRRPGCSHVRGKHKGTCIGLHYDPFGPAAPCACTAFVEPVEKKAPKLAERVEITASWDGQPPNVGDFLMGSSPRTKYGYRVIDIYERRSRDPHATKVYEIGALRVLVSEVPTGAKVHPFRWNPRDRTRNSKNNVAWGDVE